MNAFQPSTAASFPAPPPVAHEVRPDPLKVGMIAFLVSEAAFFSTLIVAYFVYLGQSKTGPTPAEVLSLPLVIGTTICLLSSSLTIYLAEKALRSGGRGAFRVWWGITIFFGTLFLTGTAYEWSDLLWRYGLTISRNLFGTTYFTLVGFHALHVTVGVLLLILMFGLIQRRQITGPHSIGVEMVSWYWHFVDGVWVVVFTVVYLIGR